jgi:hypothetical protein
LEGQDGDSQANLAAIVNLKNLQASKKAEVILAKLKVLALLYL